MTNHAQPRFEELKTSEQQALMQNFVAGGQADADASVAAINAAGSVSNDPVQ